MKSNGNPVALAACKTASNDYPGPTYQYKPKDCTAILTLISLSPVERLADEAAALHGLHECQYLQVGHVLDLIVLGLEEVLLGH